MSLHLGSSIGSSRKPSPRRTAHLALQVLASLSVSAAALAQQPIIVDVRQGTDMSVAAAPDGAHIVVDLLGQLWELPITGGAARPLTPADESARQPRFSPDGRLIAYERLIDGQSDIWLFDLATGTRRALTADGADDREPDFLPRGDAVVFASNRNGHFGLWTQTLDGAIAQPLVLESADARYPTVSDRGDIAYVAALPNGQHALKAFSRGTSRVLLTSELRLSAPSWRPGGGVVVYHATDETSNSSLNMIILAQQPIVRMLTRDEDAFAARASWISPTEYLYAADGQIWRRSLGGFTRKPVHLFAAVSIAPAEATGYRFGMETDAPQTAHGYVGVSSSRDGSSQVFSALGDIWLLAGDELKQLTDDDFWDIEPTLAGDGSFVVYTSVRDGRSQLWRVSAQGGPAQALIATASHAFAPALDSTGTRLAYLTANDIEPNAPASLHVRYLDDGNRVDGATEVQALTAPTWTEDDAETALAITSRNGANVERISFDAALRPIRREPGSSARSQPPAALPKWSLQAPIADRFVIQAGRLFDGLGSGYRRHVDIHVEHRRITAIVGRGVLPLPETVIDASDSTVLPGFIDAHVHDAPRAGNWLGRSLLAYGVTTARLLAADGSAALARGETWASGKSPGPRAIVAADAEPAAPSLPRDYPIAVGNATDILDDPIRGIGATAIGLPRELVRVLAATTAASTLPAALQRRYSPLLGQYQDVLGTIVASGYVEITGLSILAPSTVDRIIALQPGGRRDFESLLPVTESTASRSAATSPRALQARQEALGRLIRGGARVAVGSEAPLVPPGIGFLAELVLLNEAGIPADQVLRLATAGGALAIGVDRDLGSLEPSKLADMIIVDGDPLERLSDITRIRGVLVGGRWFDRDDLVNRAER